ncbi:MAG: cellulase family glycosylhydrolase [Lachnospiraceae bacterium]|nr:cellulase family glycosylhydrolase [Lachnospiraceae bacterium]
MKKHYSASTCKKILTLTLVASLMVSGLTGCGKKDATAEQVYALTEKVGALEQRINDLEEQNEELRESLENNKENEDKKESASSDEKDKEKESSKDDEKKDQSADSRQDDQSSDQNSSSDKDSDKPASSGNITTGTGSDFREKHGALSVSSDGKLVDKNGDIVQLYGMSTHGLSWFPQYVDENAFRTLRDDWGANCVRLAMYTEEYGGYCSGGNQGELKNLVRNGVNHATNLGMYVIVDWHILSDNDPRRHTEEAKAFFNEFTQNYGGYSNILYEICNEPNGGTDWNAIKEYANAVIPVIRANDPDAVIIVGTPTWCQEPDKPLADPLPYDNILYAVHFYSATHQDDLYNRVKQCADSKLPMFISEFGVCDASGNGALDLNWAKKWLEMCDSYGISYINWNLANKSESSSAISSSCSKTSGWSENELSESGKWIRKWFRNKSGL